MLSLNALLLVLFVQHNTLPVIFKSELPARIGLLPLTAKSGDEVSRVLDRPGTIQSLADIERVHAYCMQ